MEDELRRRAKGEQDPVVSEALEMTARWLDRVPPQHTCYLRSGSTENEDVAVLAAVITKHKFMAEDAVDRALNAFVESLDEEEVAS